jgi:tRNA 2-thiouridine synthesizing protein E
MTYWVITKYENIPPPSTSPARLSSSPASEGGGKGGERDKGGRGMGVFTHQGKDYEVDSKCFLMDANQWDENFAEGLAPQLNIKQGLTKEHWDVIRSIVEGFRQTGICPTVYETCRTNGLRLQDLRRLFPSGYHRGACKLAGMSSEEGRVGAAIHPTSLPGAMDFMSVYGKIYQVDVRGFLVNPEEWDEQYAVYRAVDMKINGGKLTDRHWKIIYYLRKSYLEQKNLPTVYETCESNKIDLGQLEQLFPDGYHRGAVKIAGLRNE